jgi:hypothetical protein
MKLLICIDDTDDLDSIGTGQLLENLCAALQARGLGRGGFVTRHQLLLDEAIEYTSHNSSMCCAVETENPAAVTAAAKAYLEANAAAGSDPGLCILQLQPGEAFDRLTEFGRRAQTEVLQKADAYEAADHFPELLSLTEHGGTGDGVIGALAGVGLRLTGSDGRIKGKLRPERGEEVLTAEQLCSKYGVDQIVTEDGEPLDGRARICFREPTKAVLLDHKVTLTALRDGDLWVPKPHRGRKA